MKANIIQVVKLMEQFKKQKVINKLIESQVVKQIINKSAIGHINMFTIEI